jgi:hypothetical protein
MPNDQTETAGKPNDWRLRIGHWSLVIGHSLVIASFGIPPNSECHFAIDSEQALANLFAALLRAPPPDGGNSIPRRRR